MSPVARKPAAAAPSGVAFGSLSFYSGGFLLPEGAYALEFNTMIREFTRADGSTGAPRLGVMVTAYPLAKPTEPLEQFFSMGTKANLSFAPSADGKGLEPIPGAPSAGLPRMTGWQLFLNSLYDTGLPEGIFTDSLTTLDGIWVRTQNIPEPEERKGFGAKTGEVQEERKGPQLIPVVVEILDGGKPWENSGGIPTAPVDVSGATAPAAAPARVGPKPVAAVARPVAARVAPPAAAPAAEAGDDEAVATAAINAVSDILSAAPAGVTKLLLRTNTFKSVTAKEGAEMAQAVLSTFFGDDASLNGLLGRVGYAVKGAAVAPAA